MSFSIHGVSQMGYATELMFPLFEGNIEEHPKYLCIRTEDNPDFMWGNYLLFKGAPNAQSVSEWPELYKKHFGPNNWFCTLGWTDPTIDDATLAAFEERGFALESAQTLLCERPVPAPTARKDIDVRRLELADWQRVIRNHIRFLCYGEFAVEQKKFMEYRFAAYRRMAEKGLGAWFGAFVGDELVGDMGLFVYAGVGRFQEVLTHFDYRRQGVCRTLCQRACEIAAADFGVKSFVTLASEPDAISAYNSIGFRDTGPTLGLRQYDLSGRRP